MSADCSPSQCVRLALGPTETGGRPCNDGVYAVGVRGVRLSPCAAADASYAAEFAPLGQGRVYRARAADADPVHPWRYLWHSSAAAGGWVLGACRNLLFSTVCPTHIRNRLRLPQAPPRPPPTPSHSTSPSPTRAGALACRWGAGTGSGAARRASAPRQSQRRPSSRWPARPALRPSPSRRQREGARRAHLPSPSSASPAPPSTSAGGRRCRHCGHSTRRLPQSTSCGGSRPPPRRAPRRRPRWPRCGRRASLRA